MFSSVSCARNTGSRLFLGANCLRTRGFTTSQHLLSGHSKWSTIKHDKAKNDLQKSKIATKFSNLISIAAREGGSPDPNMNVRLASTIENANKANVSKKVIENALKRAAGQGGPSGEATDVAVYEAVANGGVALVVETLTNNKNRTLMHVREVITKAQANMSPTLYLFYRRGWVDLEQADFDEVFDYALEIGALDVEQQEKESPKDKDIISVYTEPQDTSRVANALKEKYKITDMGIEYAPILDMAIKDLPKDKQKSIDALVENLEDLDDVTGVYTNMI